MKHNFYKTVEGGVFIASIFGLLSTNVYADVSSERIATYKANKLIPDNVRLVETSGDAEYVFTPEGLTWAFGSPASNTLGAYGDLTSADWRSFDWSSDSDGSAAAALLALSLGTAQSDSITQDQATSVRQMLFNSWSDKYRAWEELKMMGDEVARENDPTFDGSKPPTYNGPKDLSNVNIFRDDGSGYVSLDFPLGYNDGYDLTGFTGITLSNFTNIQNSSFWQAPSMVLTAEQDAAFGDFLRNKGCSVIVK